MMSTQVEVEVGNEAEDVQTGRQAEEVRAGRRAVLVGRTGAGKSTLTNMLVSGQPNQPALVGDGMRGTTIDCKAYHGRGWTVIDTVGLGEPSLWAAVPYHQAEIDIRRFLDRVRGRSYTHLIFVLDGTNPVDDRLVMELWGIFCSMFKGCKKNFVVICTKTTHDRFCFIKKDLTRVFGSKTEVAYVDFIPHDGSRRALAHDMERNRTALRNLEDRLDECVPSNTWVTLDLSSHQCHACACMERRLTQKIISFGRSAIKCTLFSLLPSLCTIS